MGAKAGLFGVSLAETAFKGVLDILVTVLGTGQKSVEGSGFFTGGQAQLQTYLPEHYLTVLNKTPVSADDPRTYS